MSISAAAPVRDAVSAAHGVCSEAVDGASGRSRGSGTEISGGIFIGSWELDEGRIVRMGLGGQGKGEGEDGGDGEDEERSGQ